MTVEEKIKIVQGMSIEELLQQLYQAGENAGKHPLFTEEWQEHNENAKIVKNEILNRMKEVTA